MPITTGTSAPQSSDVLMKIAMPTSIPAIPSSVFSNGMIWIVNLD